MVPTAVESRWFRACLCLAVLCALGLVAYAAMLDRRADVVEARVTAAREEYADIDARRADDWRIGAETSPSGRPGYEWVLDWRSNTWHELPIRSTLRSTQRTTSVPPYRATAIRHRASVAAWAAGLAPFALLMLFYAVRWVTCGRWVPLWPIRSAVTVGASLDAPEAFEAHAARSPLTLRGRRDASLILAAQAIARFLLTVLRWLLLAIAVWQIIGFAPMLRWLENLDQVTPNMWAIAVVKAIVGLTCWGLAAVAKWLRNKIPGRYSTGRMSEERGAPTSRTAETSTVDSPFEAPR